MSRLRASIEQLPSWPPLLLAAALIVGVGGWYYGSAWARCSELKASREALRLAIGEAEENGGRVELDRVFPGHWDEVRIAQGHRLATGQRPYHCPFGWDLTGSERQALIDAGLYTLIGFFDRGRFQRYVEYRADWAKFEGEVASLGRAEARFAVDEGGDGPAVLRPVGRP